MLRKEFIPRGYQRSMINWALDRQRCALFADMGLGKTASVLSVIDTLILAGSNCLPALVIAPLRVARSVWSGEQHKWSCFQHLRVSVMTGTPEVRAAALKAKADVYVINFENIEWLLDRLGKEWPFRYVIVDESTRLKGFKLKNSTKRAKALSAIYRRAGRWINLTGTPNPNGLMDLWGQTYFLDGGARLGRTLTEFRGRWFGYNEDTGVYTPRPYALAQITGALKDICLTVRAEDHFDLREPIITDVEVELPAKVMRVYKELESEMYAELDATTVLNPINAAAASAKCLQLASGGVIVDGGWREVHDEKLQAVESIQNELNGAPLMVAYWWKHDLARLLKRFPHARQLKTPKDESDWNEGRIPMLLVHYASAGHGLNLQYGGHHLVHFSRWWDLELDEQLRARLGPVRQMQAGLDRSVFEYNIMARGTVDELLKARHADKRSVMDLFLEGCKQ